MRKWIIAGIVLILMIGATAAVLFNLNSLIARNRDFLIGQAEQALGRKLTVGEVEATLIGGIGVRLMNFAMADDPEASTAKIVVASIFFSNRRIRRSSSRTCSTGSSPPRAPVPFAAPSKILLRNQPGWTQPCVPSRS